jgi:hypothetical protein
MYVAQSYLWCPKISHASAVQLIEDEPLEALKPIVNELVANKDKNKQRGAAEFIAGIIGGKLFEDTFTNPSLILVR